MAHIVIIAAFIGRKRLRSRVGFKPFAFYSQKFWFYSKRVKISGSRIKICIWYIFLSLALCLWNSF